MDEPSRQDRLYDETDSPYQVEVTGWGFKPRWILFLLLAIPIAGALLWWMGHRYFDSQLDFLQYQQFVYLLVVTVAGGYQLYFWVQRNNGGRRAYCVKLAIDDAIPFRPQWIWPYSFLYYLMIGVTVMSIQDLAEGMHLIFGGLMLLVTGCGIFYFVPTYVPTSFRQFEVNSISTRYLAFVQSMDNERNAFPSMHCALATYIGLIVLELPVIGIWIGVGFIAIIVTSCLLVKQHVILDTLAGVLLGGFVFQINQGLLAYFT